MHQDESADEVELPDLLTADAVAVKLHRSVSQVLLLWRSGELGGYKLGHRSVRFAPADVAQYLETHRQDPR